MKTFEELENYLSTIVTKNKKEISECEENICKADESIAKANADIAAAETAVDAETHHKAKDALWTADHAKELYQKQKEKLETIPLISKEEYKSLSLSIVQIADENHDQLNNEAVELIKEFKVLSDRAEEVTNKANSLLQLVQYEAYKDSGREFRRDGTSVVTSAKDYRNNETVAVFFYNKIEGTALGNRAGFTSSNPWNRVGKW